jgi:hypothetical protein
MSGARYVLAVDFGTSNTVAMLRWPGGRAKPLLFDGTPLLPSAVFAPAADSPTPGDSSISIGSLRHPREGAPPSSRSSELLWVGRDALHHGRHSPAGLEPNPKRRIDEGSVLLGTRETAVVELIAAVFARVGHEAARVAGGRPGTLVLSHPAGWGPVRRLVLADAAGLAGLPPPIFVSEPVAAALCFTAVLGGTVGPDETLVVYDLGAGTFDVTVLRAGADGSFDVLGSDGLDDVGGLDFDAALVKWLQPRYDPAAWARLSTPESVEDRRLRLDLWTEVRVAKEMLSRAPTVLLRPPLAEEVPLTLAEFEQIAGPLVDRTVRVAVGLARHCRVSAAHVLLVGGSSRVPLVATALHRAFGVAPTVSEQPETVVAEGCLFTIDQFTVDPAPAPVSVPPVSASTSMPSVPVPSIPLAPASPPVPAPRRPEDAVTETLPALPLTAAASPAPSTVASTVASAPPSAAARVAGPLRPGSIYPQSPWSQERPAHRSPAVAPPPRPAPGARGQVIERGSPSQGGGPDRVPGRGGGPLRTALWLVGMLVLVTALVATAVTTDIFSPGRADPDGRQSADPTAAGAAPAEFPDWPIRYADSLESQRGWSPAAYPSESATCTFRNERLEIDMAKGGIFRCPGQVDELTDFALTIDVYLLQGLPCAGIWFRRGAHEQDKDAGYLLQVCPDQMRIGHHRSSGRIFNFATFPTPTIPQNQKAEIGLVVRGGEIILFRAGRFVGRTSDNEYPKGRVALGIAVQAEAKEGHVGLHNIVMRWP